MNQKLSKEIEELRKCGLGYGKIASALNITKVSVASYCKRRNLGKEESEECINTSHCKECGKLIVIKRGHRHSLFCDTNCKNKYWNKHRDELNKKIGLISFASSVRRNTLFMEGRDKSIVLYNAMYGNGKRD